MSKKTERAAVFHPEFREDLAYWDKPEALRFVLAGCWSRRITQEHRLVYRVTAERIDFLQARYHYE
jgi:toxin YoeB